MAREEKGMRMRLGRTKGMERDRNGSEGRWIEAAKQLLSGAMSAVVARTCCAPLERVKLELLLNRKRGGWKVFRNVVKAEGVTGLWKGNLLNIARTAPFKAINFYSFEVFKNHFLRKNDTEEMNGPQRFVAGAGAGITAVSLCFPLDMIRTRLLVEGGYARYGGFRNAVVDIFKSEGPKAFYIGITPALISLGMSGAVFYGVYDMLKLRHLHNNGRQVKGSGGRKALEMGPAYTLLYGAMAGVAAEFTVYPLEVIRRRLQLQSIHGLSSSQSSGLVNMGRMFVQVVQAEGLIGLYSGVMPTAIQVMPSAALSYFTYEAMKYAINA